MPRAYLIRLRNNHKAPLMIFALSLLQAKTTTIFDCAIYGRKRTPPLTAWYCFVAATGSLCPCAPHEGLNWGLGLRLMPPDCSAGLRTASLPVECAMMSWRNGIITIHSPPAAAFFSFAWLWLVKIIIPEDVKWAISHTEAWLTWKCVQWQKNTPPVQIYSQKNIHSSEYITSIVWWSKCIFLNDSIEQSIDKNCPPLLTLLRQMDIHGNAFDDMI